MLRLLMNKKLILNSKKLILTLACLLLVGCQSFQPTNPGELALENDGFIGLWDTYNACLNGSNTQDMQENLQALHSAPKPLSLDDSPISIPDFIKELASTRNSRLSVDPRAMAASCSIRIAEVAQQSGDWKTSLFVFQDTVKSFPEPQYAFYVSKATQAIEQFSGIMPASLSSNRTLLQ